MTGGGFEVLSGPAAPIVAARWQRINYERLVLTHYDFWSGNVVWDAHRLSGIVDWNRGSLGPRGFDVGWCRLDLYLLYDEEIADLFCIHMRLPSVKAYPTLPCGTCGQWPGPMTLYTLGSRTTSTSEDRISRLKYCASAMESGPTTRWTVRTTFRGSPMRREWAVRHFSDMPQSPLLLFGDRGVVVGDVVVPVARRAPIIPDWRAGGKLDLRSLAGVVRHDR